MRAKRKGSMNAEMEGVEQEPLDMEKMRPKQKDDLSGLMDKLTISVVGKEHGNDSDHFVSDGSDEEEDEQDDISDSEAQALAEKSNKHTKYTDLETRAQDDMDFPDEVDTPFKDASVRFQKYRGIKSLRNCDWDPYENLPEDYGRVWRFENFQLEQKNALA